MNFYDYMFGANKKSVTDVSDKTVCDEVSEKSVKDALVEELEETETEKTAEDYFKEEDHPRGGKGSEKGGQFVKSEKTKRKEDEDLDNLGGKSQYPSKQEMSNNVNKIVKENVQEIKEGTSDPKNAIHGWQATGSVGMPNNSEEIYTGNVTISGYCGTQKQHDKKVKAAKESALDAVKYLSEQTGKNWRIIAQEMYDKEGEELKEGSSWDKCNDVTFVFGIEE